MEVGRFRTHADYTNWRLHLHRPDYSHLAGELHYAERRLFWSLIVSVIAVAGTVAGTGNLFGLRIPSVETMGRIALALQIGSVFLVALAGFLHWRLLRGRRRDLARREVLASQLDELGSDPSDY